MQTVLDWCISRNDGSDTIGQPSSAIDVKFVYPKQAGKRKYVWD